MNVSQARIVLRPRGPGEIIDLSSQIVGKHALGLYLKLAAIVLIPTYAACLTLRYGLELEWVWVWMLATIATTVAQGVFTIAAGRWLFAQDLTVLDVLKAFASRAPSYCAAMVFRTVLVFGSVVAFFITPVVVATLLLYAPEASLLEMAGPGAALSRSNNFSRHTRARAFADWLSLVLLTGTCIALAHFLCDGLVAKLLQLGNPFEKLEDVGGSPYTLLGLILSAPYVATARFLMYIDGRTRSDGWDIQVRFMAMAHDSEDLGPSAPGTTAHRRAESRSAA